MLYVPPGPISTPAEVLGGYPYGFRSYRMSRQLDLDHGVVMMGAGQTSTILKFDDGHNGIVAWSNNNSPAGGNAGTSIVRQMLIRGGEKWSNPPSVAGGLYYARREESTAYVVGDVVSANTYARNLPGRSFKCVVAGTTAAGDETQPAFDTVLGTSGQIDANTNALTVADPTGFSVGDWIIVEIPGYYLIAQITAIAGSVFTLSANAKQGAGPAYQFGADASVRQGWQDGSVWWVDIDAHGILDYGKTRFEDVTIHGFSGNGYACIASVPTAGNANNAQVHTCVASLCGGNGFYAHGNDANMLVFLGCDAFQNGGWGYVDDGFLGSRFYGCESDDNLRGSFWMTHGAIHGGYAEGGQGPIFIGASAQWIDGFSTEGFTGEVDPPTWTPGTAYAQFDLVRPTVPNGYLYKVLAAPTGPAGAVEPTWPAARGFQVTDGGVAWYAYQYDTRSLGYKRNGNAASFTKFEGRDAPAGKATRFLAGSDENPAWFFGWESDQDAGSKFNLADDYHGVGWQAVTWNGIGPPTQGQPMAFATQRAVDAGTARHAGQLMIPDPHIVGSVFGDHIYEWASSAAPTSGDWIVGSKVHNTAPAELGSAGSKYVVTGWICVAAGSPGTWLEMRSLTGN